MLLIEGWAYVANWPKTTDEAKRDGDEAIFRNAAEATAARRLRPAPVLRATAGAELHSSKKATVIHRRSSGAPWRRSAVPH